MNEQTKVAVYLSKSLMLRIDEELKILQRESERGIQLSRSDAMRVLLERGLAVSHPKPARP